MSPANHPAPSSGSNPHRGYDRRFMQEALRLAKRAGRQGEVPVGAVVVSNGVVIGSGHNRPISGHDPTAHAEIEAIRAAAKSKGNYRLDGCTLYVTLEPCPMCFAAAAHARIARIVYAAPDMRAGACGGAIDLLRAKWHQHRPVVDTGPLEQQAADLLTEFFQQRR